MFSYHSQQIADYLYTDKECSEVCHIKASIDIANSRRMIIQTDKQNDSILANLVP